MSEVEHDEEETLIGMEWVRFIWSLNITVDGSITKVA